MKSNTADGVDEIDLLNKSEDYHVSSMNEEECENLLKPYLEDKLYSSMKLCNDCKRRSGII